MSSIFQKPPQNYLYSVGLSNIVDVRVDGVQVNGPQTAALLHSLVVPSRTLVQTGQVLKYSAVGAVLNSNGIASFILNFAGSNIMTAARPIGGGVQVGWRIESEMMRFTDNSLLCHSFLFRDYEINSLNATTVIVSGVGANLTPVNFNVENLIELRVTDVAGDAVNISRSFINVQ